MYVNALSLPGLPKCCAPPARPRTASSWSPDELAFAESLIALWSQAFSGIGPRANKTRHNRYLGVQLHRWLHSPDNQSASSAQSAAPAPLTEEDCFIGIRAYAEDPWNINKCNRRWQSFGDWLATDRAADNIDKQLARIGRPRGAGVSHESPGKRFAEGLLAWMDIGHRAEMAGKLTYDLADFLSLSAKRTAGRDSDYTYLAALAESFAAFSSAWRTIYFDRAANGLRHLLDRPPKSTLADRNILYALALALYARDHDQSPQSTPPPEAPHA